MGRLDKKNNGVFHKNSGRYAYDPSHDGLPMIQPVGDMQCQIEEKPGIKCGMQLKASVRPGWGMLVLDDCEMPACSV
jgi:hypothetical protein